jgi:hypothetical protein
MMSRRSKADAPDLLVRPPVLVDAEARTDERIHVTDQLTELEDLRRRGLLSRREYDRQRRKVLGP